MNSSALRILRKVARDGDMSLADAIALADSTHGDHRDQYPLAMLLEGEYLGMTITHTPPTGAEKMREYSIATTLHMFRIQKRGDGSVEYRGIVSTGSIEPKQERVFLKAKGALYLGEARQKRRDRLASFIVGVLVAVTTLAIKTWFENKPNQAPLPTPTAVTPAASHPSRQP